MNSGLIDMHVHTKYSGEGIITSPRSILLRSLAIGVETLSITDHNSTRGCREALDVIKQDAEQFAGIRFIPGIEITCDTASIANFRDYRGVLRSSLSGGIHLLGYGIDPYHPKFLEMENMYSSIDGRRALGICKFLKRYYKLDVDKNLVKYKVESGKIDAENIFDELCINKTSLFKSLEEYIAFRHNLEKDVNKYNEFKLRINECLTCKDDDVDNYAKQDIYEMLDLIEKSGGVAVIAHPTLYRPKMEVAMSDFALLEQLLDGLVDTTNKYTGEKMRGVVGLELLHGRSFDEQFKFKFLDNIIQKKGLYVTGGSDAHIKTKNYNNFFGIIRQNYSIVSLDFLNDFEKIKSSPTRICNFNKSVENQSSMKNDYQIIKPSDILQGRTISEKVVRFEREFGGVVYLIKNDLKFLYKNTQSKNIAQDFPFERYDKLSYQAWLSSIYLQSVLDNSSVLFDNQKNFTEWLNQRRKFYSEIKKEIKVELPSPILDSMETVYLARKAKGKAVIDFGNNYIKSYSPNQNMEMAIKMIDKILNRIDLAISNTTKVEEINK